MAAARRGAADLVPAWTVWVLRAQLGLVYFYGGVAKLNADWLLHAEPLRIWLAARGTCRCIGPLLAEHGWVAYAFSWAGAAFDLSIVPFLALAADAARSRTRSWSSFHLLTSVLFPIGIFPWLMIGLTPIFFDPRGRGVARRLRPARSRRGADALPTVPFEVRR